MNKLKWKCFWGKISTTSIAPIKMKSLHNTDRLKISCDPHEINYEKLADTLDVPRHRVASHKAKMRFSFHPLRRRDAMALGVARNNSQNQTFGILREVQLITQKSFTREHS